MLIPDLLRYPIRAALLAALVAAPAAHADFYLVRRISLAADFGPLGNNPFQVITDGTHAYIGGYSGATLPREIGILKISLDDPINDKAALTPGGTQTVNQFHYYGGLVVQSGILYALTDRPDGTVANTNVRAIDVTTGALLDTFDGDFGNGNGIVTQPAGLIQAAIGGLAYDPGFGGFDFGLSILATTHGRRILLDIANGITIYASSDGMIVAHNPAPCTVSDQTSWRDQVYDAVGNVFTRRSNQVQRSNRTGPNAIGSYGHLTDELNADGTPKAGCGDGRPITTRVAATVVGQHLELIPAASAGTDQDLIIFNDRYDNSTKSFASVVRMIDTNGDLPSPPVQLLDGDGSALSTTFDVADGIGLYDFYYDATEDRLLLLDFTHRNLLVFSGTPTCNMPPQDADGNGEVDAADAGPFVECLGGPNQPWPGPPVDQGHCACVDAGGDNDVDLQDWWIFQDVADHP